MEDTANAFIETFTLDGADTGSLTGLTFGVKDLYDVAGRAAGCGNPEWKRPRLRRCWTQAGGLSA
jgi:amidase